MYLCLDCGRLFEEPKSYTEKHNLDTPPYEHWSGCPVCSGGYVETMKCDVCDEWIVGEYIKLKNNTFVCENCYDVKSVEDLE